MASATIRFVLTVALLPANLMLADDGKNKDDERARVTARRHLRRIKSVGTSEVKVRLISDVESYVAGKPFRIGLHFSIGKGWHIYSHQPGDGYLPTKVDWKVPEGYEVVKAEWPTAEKIDGFPAYHKAVMATIWVKPKGTTTAAKTLEFSANATWQFCHEDGVCRLGKGVPSLSLKPGSGKPSRVAALFPAANAPGK